MTAAVRVSWPVVAARALRTLLVLMRVAAAIRLACLPGRRPGSGERAYSAGARALLRAVRVDLRIRPPAARTDGAALIVANHVSWLDILVLAASEPMVPVAKCEIAAWPVIGPVAGDLGAVFIDRSRLRALPRTVDDMADALREGRSVQVFPEATTRCGTALDPFRRAAFQAAIDARAPVRPVGVFYRDVTGRPTTATAFVGDQTVLSSVVTLLRGGPVTATVAWAEPIAPPVSVRPAADRAILAHAAEQAVAAVLDQQVLTRPRRLTTAGPRNPGHSRPPERPQVPPDPVSP